MLLPLLSDQLAELFQAVGQAVVQPEHHPKLADPVPVGSARHPITDTGRDSQPCPRAKTDLMKKQIFWHAVGCSRSSAVLNVRTLVKELPVVNSLEFFKGTLIV